MLTIKHPSTEKILQVADDDLPIRMHFYEASHACKKLGSEWRLPTIKELQEIYKQLYKNGLGNFKSKMYWSISSTEFVSLEGNYPYAWCLDFDNGTSHDFVKGTAFNVRAVREI
jgi:hypothetical protein